MPEDFRDRFERQLKGAVERESEERRQRAERAAAAIGEPIRPPTPETAVPMNEVILVIIGHYNAHILRTLDPTAKEEDITDLAAEMAAEMAPGLEADLFARFDHCIADSPQPQPHTTRNGRRLGDDK